MQEESVSSVCLWRMTRLTSPEVVEGKASIKREICVGVFGLREGGVSRLLHRQI